MISTKKRKIVDEDDYESKAVNAASTVSATDASSAVCY